MSRSRQEKKWRTNSTAAIRTLDMSLWVHGYRCRQTVRAGLYKWLYAFLVFVDHAPTAWIQGFPGIDVTTDLKEHDSRTSDAPRDSVRQMLTGQTPRQPPDCGHETMYEVSSGEGVDCIGTSGNRRSLPLKECYKSRSTRAMQNQRHQFFQT